MSDYINSPTDEEEERKQSSGFAISGICRVAYLCLGLMCVLQAILNISLRLHTSEPCDNITEFKLERDQQQQIIYMRESKYLGCPPHWLSSANSCYLFSTKKENWAYAALDCMGRGANLFTVRRPEQQELLYTSRVDRIWISFHSVSQKKTRGSIHLGDGDCVSFIRSQDQLNASCDMSNYWLCEKSYDRVRTLE